MLVVMMVSAREAILEEMVDRVGEGIGRDTVMKKVEHFMKHGNLFLFFEVMNLRREIELMKGKIQVAPTLRQSKR